MRARLTSTQSKRSCKKLPSNLCYGHRTGGTAAVAVAQSLVAATAVFARQCTAVCVAAAVVVCCSDTSTVGVILGAPVGSRLFFTLIATGAVAPKGVPPDSLMHREP